MSYRCSYLKRCLIKTISAYMVFSASAVCAQSAVSSQSWSTVWQAPQSDAFLSVTANQATLRQILTVHASGKQVRVRLSNLYGKTPVSVGAASVGVSAGGASIAADGTVALSFDGRPGVLLAPGESRFSDPVKLPVQSMQRLAVSLYIPGSAVSISRHFTGNELIWSAPGNRVSQTGERFFSQNSNLLQASTVLVDRLDVDVASSPVRRVVAVFGDSLTDGFMGSPTGIPMLPGSEPIGRDLRFPDFLQRRADAEGVAVTFVSAAISGNRLLTDATLPLFGPSGQSRLKRDVLTMAGVTDAIVLIGINDLGYSSTPGTTAQSLMAGLSETVQRLHETGLRVTVGTLLPARGAKLGFGHGSAAVDNARMIVNQWIRAHSLADAVVDFDACMQDPASPSHLRPAYDSGDSLHPNGAGYRAMGACVPMDNFK